GVVVLSGGVAASKAWLPYFSLSSEEFLRYTSPMSLFWTEEIIDRLDLRQPQLLNDSKTPSGAVHMGSPISPMIHDAIMKQVIARGGTATLQFGFDDFDVIDGLSEDLMPTHQQYF